MAFLSLLSFLPFDLSSLDLSPLWISLKVSSIATLMTFLMGTVAAYRMVGYRGRWRSLIDSLCIAPLILPPTVVGFMLLQLFGKYGPVGQLLQFFNIDIIFTWYAGAIAATVVTFPLMYRTALGAFEQIDSNLLSVARTLGASEIRLFWRIAFPLALPGILAGATLAFARGLGEFGATLMLAGNIPGVTTTIPLAIYTAVETGDTQQAWFWSVLILSVCLCAIAAVNAGLFGWGAGERGTRGTRGTRGQGEREERQNKEDREGIEQLKTQNSKLKTQNSPTSQPPIPPLLIDIQKHLLNFSLRVVFHSDRQPLGILGASGAGKSLLLKCIAGMEMPDAGRIVVNGRVLFDAERGINLPSRDRRIGMIVQNYALFPHLTVAQNVAFGIPQTERKKHSSASLRQRVEAQLQTVQLQGMGDRYSHQLSGGQQQRVAFARALISRPDMLLLDEPFSALDTHLRYQIEQELIAILSDYSGVTLFVTHNLEEAYRICQTLLVLEQGQKILHDRKQAIFEHPQTVSVARLTGCKNVSRAMPTGTHEIAAIDWGCTLQTAEFVSQHHNHVGIRAHQLIFLHESDNQESDKQEIGDRRPLSTPHPPPPTLHSPPPNTFPCWLAATSETPHRMTLYLKLHSPPTHSGDYHLQVEVFKEKWAGLKDKPPPWTVYLDPLRLMLLSDRG